LLSRYQIALARALIADNIYVPMSKIRQIDYSTPRTLHAYSGRRVVRITGEETRYQFSGKMIAGEEDGFAKIGVIRKDWQKSAFPLPWSDSPDVVRPD